MSHFLPPNELNKLKEIEKRIEKETEVAEKLRISIEPESLEEILASAFSNVKPLLEKGPKGILDLNYNNSLKDSMYDASKKFEKAIGSYVNGLKISLKEEKEKKFGPIVKLISKYSKTISHSDYEQWILESLSNAKLNGEKIPEFDLNEVVEHLEQPIK